jgi:GNAT superfamily N-acetyltransferase
VIVREATADDDAILAGFLEAIIEELWDRPWPPPERSPDQWQGKLVLLAEDDDEPIGFTYGEIFPNRVAHVNIVYVRPERRRQGIANELLRVFSAHAREGGAEHLTLDVDTTNEIGRAVWERLGFFEWACRLRAPLHALEARLSGGEGA